MRTMTWDLWIDFQRADDEGLTRGNIRNLRTGIQISVGDVIVVGNEDAEPGVAEVVELGDRGVVVVRVFPGGIEENRFRLRPGLASAS
jgi:predicted RNA-binding protein with EMAP domain